MYAALAAQPNVAIIAERGLATLDCTLVMRSLCTGSVGAHPFMHGLLAQACHAISQATKFVL